MHGSHTLEHCYPESFVTKSDGISTRLEVLSCDTLLDSICGFSANIPSGYRTKAGLTKLIMNDFSQQMTELVTSTRPPPVCQFVHKQCGPVVGPQLMCQSTRRNPPELMEVGAIVPSADWRSTSAD